MANGILIAVSLIFVVGIIVVIGLIFFGNARGTIIIHPTLQTETSPLRPEPSGVPTTNVTVNTVAPNRPYLGPTTHHATNAGTHHHATNSGTHHHPNVGYAGYSSYPVPANTLKNEYHHYHQGSGSLTSVSDKYDHHFHALDTRWEKIGVVTTTSLDDDTILNFYRRSVSKVHEIYEYQVEDKNGFVIKLPQTLLEDGDIIPEILGKESKGSWKVKIFSKDRWVYV